jgi:catechol 2,3-dioxygenase-like lactoylglutathione lyase family enzyme
MLPDMENSNEQQTRSEQQDPRVGPTVSLGVIALDTDDPRGLADFYAALLGWQVSRSDEDWIEVHPGGIATPGVAGLAFQLVRDHQRPTWPSQERPQQLHLDLEVADLDEGERFALSLGAERAAEAGAEDTFRVFLDPSGHPFCLCRLD